jgi:DNA-binding XRE family transcriptional regulator
VHGLYARIVGRVYYDLMTGIARNSSPGLNLHYTVYYTAIFCLTYSMKKIDEVGRLLEMLAGRLRAARVARNDTMEVFAERIGVSTGTVRAMERGSSTVAIGAWLNALWALDRLAELERVLQPRPSLLDTARAAGKTRRQRASKPRR